MKQGKGKGKRSSGTPKEPEVITLDDSAEESREADGAGVAATPAAPMPPQMKPRGLFPTSSPTAGRRQASPAGFRSQQQQQQQQRRRTTDDDDSDVVEILEKYSSPRGTSPATQTSEGTAGSAEVPKNSLQMENRYSSHK